MNVCEHIYALFEKGHYKECLRLCVSNLEKTPYEFYAWFYKGKSEYELGFYKEAIKSFEQSARLAPQEDEVWLSLGCALELSGKKMMAMKAYRKEITLFPDGSSGWMALAAFLTRIKRYRLAKTIFRAIEVNSVMDYFMAGYEYAIALYHAGSLDEEFKLYKKLIDIGYEEKWVKVNFENIIRDMDNAAHNITSSVDPKISPRIIK